ncbi:MAG: substrate-binding domain-containing protein [Rhodocyclaceae bacterium]|nr:substrate-binding domain-containing protein [Rhodocyclaceae bacterium]
MWKTIGVFLLACGLALPASAGDDTMVIAFAQDDMANDFRRAQVQAVRDALAEHPDLRFVHADAQGRTSLLIRQIDRFTARPVDLLIVGTNGDRAVVPAVTKAYEAGIPVIVLDRGIQSDRYTTFINSDNARIGRLAAEFIAERLAGNGTVLLFEGLPSADVTQLRTQGFLDEIGRHEGIRVVRRVGNFLRRDAVVEMEKLVAAGVTADAIFAESDSMLSGIRAVLTRHGIDPASIVTVGCDFIGEARDAIFAGTQTASVKFPLGGRESVQIAVEILAGNAVPKHVVIPVEMVTRENVDRVAPVF